ncbi:hypothetical protein LCGC14_1040530 [marine sediment metagenome]|uniref:Uncharacterized protein n=1 Tax=marine sediment metagenome TaxID=412755 RepID=A0A0F9QY22_9ZZZZ|nr:hypothetical protein [bacterium]
MWLHNAINLIKVNAYNEKDVVRDTGGITKKEDNTIIELKILIVPTINRFRQGETGRFEEKPLLFQVSKSELNKKSFTVKVGKTHIIRNNEDYKVMQVQDASWDPGLQLYECLAKRMIPVGNLI